MKQAPIPTAQRKFLVLSRNAEHTDTPEHKLMLAILYQAVVDLTESSDPYVVAEVKRFMKSKWFVAICDFVGLNPQFTREIMMKGSNGAWHESPNTLA